LSRGKGKKFQNLVYWFGGTGGRRDFFSSSDKKRTLELKGKIYKK
jgi:hypothetical protein